MAPMKVRQRSDTVCQSNAIASFFPETLSRSGVRQDARGLLGSGLRVQMGS